MKAVRVVAPGSPEALRIVDVPEPELGRRDVRIKVHAASLNYRDLLIAKGLYPGPLREQPIPLSDGAGEIVAVGAEVERFQVGDRVIANCNPHWNAGPFLEEYRAGSIGMTADGMLAETITIDQGGLVPLPDTLSFAEGAALPCAAVSAWSALNVQEPLQAGQTVLIQGTGGVALFGLQLARIHGARVLAITSSDEKAEFLQSLGADGVVNYNATSDWHMGILEMTGGRGVDKVVEIGGERTIQQSVAATRFGGELGLVGFVSGFGGGLPPLDIMARSVILKGIAIGPRLSLERVVASFASSTARPVICERFAFDDYASAYAFMERGEHRGKVVIDVA